MRIGGCEKAKLRVTGGRKAMGADVKCQDCQAAMEKNDNQLFPIRLDYLFLLNTRATTSLSQYLFHLAIFA